MRLISFALACWFAVLSPAVACDAGGMARSTSATRLVEPLFGARLAETTVEPASPDLATRCPALESKRWARRMWIFASAKVGDTTYLVVAGQFVDRAKPAVQMVDETGALLAYDATGCQMIGPPREVFDYGADQAPPAVLDTLAKDAARRYMIAAGNKRALDRLVGRALAKAPPSLSKAFGDELGR